MKTCAGLPGGASAGAGRTPKRPWQAASPRTGQPGDPAPRSRSSPSGIRCEPIREGVRANGRGPFLAPTDPPAREGVFGPVLSVIAVDTEEGAVRLAGDPPCGLAASVRTDDRSRAMRGSDALPVGTVSGDAVSVATPFVGLTPSGRGRDLSRHPLDRYTAPRTVWIGHDA